MYPEEAQRQRDLWQIFGARAAAAGGVGNSVVGYGTSNIHRLFTWQPKITYYEQQQQQQHQKNNKAPVTITSDSTLSPELVGWRVWHQPHHTVPMQFWCDSAEQPYDDFTGAYRIIGIALPRDNQALTPDPIYSMVTKYIKNDHDEQQFEWELVGKTHAGQWVRLPDELGINHLPYVSNPKDRAERTRVPFIDCAGALYPLCSAAHAHTVLQSILEQKRASRLKRSTIAECVQQPEPDGPRYGGANCHQGPEKMMQSGFEFNELKWLSSPSSLLSLTAAASPVNKNGDDDLALIPSPPEEVIFKVPFSRSPPPPRKTDKSCVFSRTTTTTTTTTTTVTTTTSTTTKPMSLIKLKNTAAAPPSQPPKVSVPKWIPIDDAMDEVWVDGPPATFISRTKKQKFTVVTDGGYYVIHGKPSGGMYTLFRNSTIHELKISEQDGTTPVVTTAIYDSCPISDPTLVSDNADDDEDDDEAEAEPEQPAAKSKAVISRGKKQKEEQPVEDDADADADNGEDTVMSGGEIQFSSAVSSGWLSPPTAGNGTAAASSSSPGNGNANAPTGNGAKKAPASSASRKRSRPAPAVSVEELDGDDANGELEEPPAKKQATVSSKKAQAALAANKAAGISSAPIAATAADDEEEQDATPPPPKKTAARHKAKQQQPAKKPAGNPPSSTVDVSSLIPGGGGGGSSGKNLLQKSAPALVYYPQISPETAQKRASDLQEQIWDKLESLQQHASTDKDFGRKFKMQCGTLLNLSSESDLREYGKRLANDLCMLPFLAQVLRLKDPYVSDDIFGNATLNVNATVLSLITSGLLKNREGKIVNLDAILTPPSS